MKKKLFAVIFAVVIASVGLIGASCVSTSALISKEKYSISVSNASFLNEKTSIIGSDDLGNLIIANHEDISNVKYSVVNVNDGKTVVAPVNKLLSILDDGLFYYTETIDGETHYTFLSANGDAVPSKIKGVISDGVFTDNAGARYYVNVKDKVVKEEDPFKFILPKCNAYELECGKFFDTNNGNVFSRNGKFEFSYSEVEVYTYEEAEYISNMFIGDYTFVQFLIPLPESAKDFDLYYDGTKVDLVTLRVSLKNGKVKEIKNFEYIIDSQVYANNEKGIAIVECQKIHNKLIVDNEIVQSFNKNGKVAVDLQKLMPNCNEATIVDKYLILEVGDGIKSIFKGFRKLLTTDKNLNILSNGLAYYRSGENVHIYDFAKGKIVTTFENVISYDKTTAGNLKMLTSDSEGNKKLVIYNTKNKESQSYSANNLAGLNYLPFIVCDNVLVFMDDSSLNISNIQSWSVIEVLYLEDEIVRIVELEDVSGNNRFVTIKEKANRNNLIT